MSGRSLRHSGDADQKQRAVKTLSAAVKIACAYVSHNAIDAKALPAFICMLHQAVAAVTHEGRCEEEYRTRWALPPDYPMVAPAYSAARSAVAKRTGLGRGVRRKI